MNTGRGSSVLLLVRTYTSTNTGPSLLLLLLGMRRRNASIVREQWTGGVVVPMYCQLRSPPPQSCRAVRSGVSGDTRPSTSEKTANSSNRSSWIDG